MVMETLLLGSLTFILLGIVSCGVGRGLSIVSPRFSASDANYAIFKAFDAFKKRNKLTGRVRSIWAYFPFRIIVPPACLSVGVVPLLKMFTRLRIGVDLAFTCYYSVALCIHLIAINESTIKQYMQLRLAEVVVIEPVSTVTPSRTSSGQRPVSSYDAGAELLPRPMRGVVFRAYVRALGVLLIAGQAVLIAAAADANPSLPQSMEAISHSAGQCDREAVALEAMNASDVLLGQSDMEVYLTARATSPAALFLVVSNVLVAIYFALSLFASQTLYLKLLEFSESVEKNETAMSSGVRQNPRSLSELRKSLGFMAETVRSSHRVSIVIVLLFVVFTFPWLWPHQEFLHATFCVMLVPPFIAHLKIFAGDMRFGIDESPTLIHAAAAERAPLAVRINGGGKSKTARQPSPRHEHRHHRSPRHQRRGDRKDKDKDAHQSSRSRRAGDETERAGRSRDTHNQDQGGDAAAVVDDDDDDDDVEINAALEVVEGDETRGGRGGGAPGRAAYYSL